MFLGHIDQPGHFHSSCVFYSVRQETDYNLYRVSLPDLAIQLVDEGIQTTSAYQWLGGK